jgi:CheY-like chemotaxis protein/glycine cleavage system H lipoate-binding protein
VGERKTILVIDDEIRICQSFERALVKEGYQVLTYTRSTEALERLKTGGVDLIVSDLMMPDKTGLDVLKEIRDQAIETHLVMITGYANIENALETMRLGAVEYLPKPFTVAELKAAVARGLRAGEINPAALPAAPKGTYEIVRHSWTRKGEGREMLVGVHPFVLACCGRITEIELSMEEDELIQGGAFGKLVADDHRVPIRLWCPITGCAKTANARAVEQPSVVAADPYGAGWLLKVEASNLEHDLPSLVARF